MFLQLSIPKTNEALQNQFYLLCLPPSFSISFYFVTASATGEPRKQTVAFYFPLGSKEFYQKNLFFLYLTALHQMAVLATDCFHLGV